MSDYTVFFENIFLIGQFILFILLTIAYMLIFTKKGIKKIFAIIPIVREYQLSIVAEREEDGRTFCIVDFFYEIFSLFIATMNQDSALFLFSAIAELTLAIILFIYSIRIYLGLCKEFNKSKKWIFLFMIFKTFTLLYWGLNKNFVPQRPMVKDTSAQTSNIYTSAIEKGLTLNLKERTAVKFFRKKVLLKDIHLAIPTGHMVLLLGGSGAGKTTFVNAATGYEKADAEVLLNGKDVYQDYEEMKYDLGFVPQQDLMRDTDTVHMTLSDAAALRLPSTVSIFERNKRIKEVLDLFGLSAVKGNLVSSLSGGQRKRLSIAMEYISDPALFFLDEPDSGLDGVLARKLFTKLRDIANQGKIVVVITHTPDRVIDLFDEVIVLAKDFQKTGRLAFYGPVEDAYSFFGKQSMEEILLSINPTDEGGEGKSDEYISKYSTYLSEKAGQMA
ncbi:MAG: ABC transporter ATP-binding protein [Butyrivibrio sp.]|nr:ABC transporter ATP-binding protein [Butyrivibrio sp.]